MTKKENNSRHGGVKKIYFDNASTTPVDSSVLKEMNRFWSQDFSNAGAIHSGGIFVKNEIEKSRKKIASILNCHPNEIIFTSGGTESDNLALFGVVNNFLEDKKNITHSASLRAGKKPNIIVSNIEHPAILESCKALEKRGIEIIYIPVEKNGVIDPNLIKKKLNKNTILVSVMYVNNEIGTIQPIQEIAKTIRHFKKVGKRCGLKSRERSFLEETFHYPIFHTDACQAINYLPVKVDKLGIDMMTFNGSKIYGPKGIGVLYKKRNIPINPIIYGGGQEFGLRSGTEFVSGILGLSKALEITEKIKEKESKRLSVLRDYFIKKIKTNFPNVIINGDLEKRLPNNVNISISEIESELLILELDAKGIMVSEKSACQSSDPEESYVIQAIRGKDQHQGGVGKKTENSVRFSLGRSTTKKEIDYVLKSLKSILEKLNKWKY
ncbi:MAG: cysteine desulfurase family protein [Candidatus Paceibacterota bacterium]|jgi:cysteine desulfurase